MKIYRRADGFEVCDNKDRSIDWVTSKYGGSFVEVPPAVPPTKDELKAIRDTKLSKKSVVLAKLGITEDDWASLMAV